MNTTQYIARVAGVAREASAALRIAPTAVKNRALVAAARLLGERRDAIREANAADYAAAGKAGLSEALLDRLLLSEERIDAMIAGVDEIAALQDPVGECMAVRRPAGFVLQKVRVPIGVVAIIYESRPNVTVDAGCLCIKSGNACVLRGGKEALASGLAIAGALQDGLEEAGLPRGGVQYVERTDREGVTALAQASGLVDLIVPRGGEALIRRVVEDATVPVIKHYTGNCHLYVDEHADLDMACRVVHNSKLQRLGVCNTLESLLIHSGVAAELLPKIAARLEGVELRGDETTRRLVPDALVATEEDYGAEYLDRILSVKVVDSLEEATVHIDRYGSHHTDGIISGDVRAVEAFVEAVDSAVVTVNASTRLSDGGVFGLGAEIGISTDKLHARGPMGVAELTTYKWVVRGDGTLRS